jgi:hypothetical protein
MTSDELAVFDTTARMSAKPPGFTNPEPDAAKPS